MSQKHVLITTAYLSPPSRHLLRLSLSPRHLQPTIQPRTSGSTRNLAPHYLRIIILPPSSSVRPAPPFGLRSALFLFVQTSSSAVVVVHHTLQSVLVTTTPLIPCLFLPNLSLLIGGATYTALSPRTFRLSQKFSGPIVVHFFVSSPFF